MPISSHLKVSKHKHQSQSAAILPNPYKVITVYENEELLRSKSDDYNATEITSDESQLFFDQLYLAMLAEQLPDGWMHAGVSAVQVGKLLNVFYAYNGNYDTYELFINPKIELLGSATDIKEESCLSIPDKIAPVRRHKRVRVKYWDRDGKKHKEKFTGWNARVIQHEYDHLQGVLFTDKVAD